MVSDPDLDAAALMRTWLHPPTVPLHGTVPSQGLRPYIAELAANVTAHGTPPMRYALALGSMLNF